MLQIDNILIIGCGNIGLRHLQSIAMGSINSPNIFVFDPIIPNKSVLKRAFKSHTGLELNENLKIEVLESPFYGDEPDLVIVATTSKARDELLIQLVTTFKRSKFLIEKPVFSSAKNYQSLEPFNSSNVYVNYPRRMWALYRDIKRETQSARGPFSMSVVGDNWAPGTNAFHFLDLFSFLSGVTQYNLVGKIHSVFPSKRYGYFDFEGLIECKVQGAELNLTNRKTTAGDENFLITISANGVSFVVDELNGHMSVEKSDGILNEGIHVPYQSSLTTSFVKSLFLGEPLLTGFMEAVSQERALFEFVDASEFPGLETPVRFS